MLVREHGGRTGKAFDEVTVGVGNFFNHLVLQAKRATSSVEMQSEVADIATAGARTRARVRIARGSASVAIKSGT